MTKLVLTRKEKKPKYRSALYMDRPLGEKLEQIAKFESMSFNRLCVGLIEHALRDYEAGK